MIWWNSSKNSANNFLVSTLCQQLISQDLRQKCRQRNLNDINVKSSLDWMVKSQWARCSLGRCLEEGRLSQPNFRLIYQKGTTSQDPKLQPHINLNIESEKQLERQKGWELVSVCTRSPEFQYTNHPAYPRACTMNGLMILSLAIPTAGSLSLFWTQLKHHTLLENFLMVLPKVSTYLTLLCLIISFMCLVAPFPIGILLLIHLLYIACCTLRRYPP